MSLRLHVTRAFEDHFGKAPAFIVRAPGRVNLIGEHTDYNDGFVLPIAINRAVWIAFRARDDRMVKLHSLDLDEMGIINLDQLRSGTGWSEYVKGIAWAMQGDGYRLRGWEGVLAGDVPIGAGLSSSAALEMATARAFTAASGYPWDAVRLARLGQKAENDWVGVNCGIMDQMISALGRPGKALLIDCRSLETQLVPLPKNSKIVVLDTNTRRGLTDSAYNERRLQCEAAATLFGVHALRDVDLQTFSARAHELEEPIRRRARHVITENRRVLQAREAMLRADPQALGQLMNASHASLRADYEVSSRELDIMVAAAQERPGCFGARMTGAGFGGCAVALVDSAQIDDFVPAVTRTYFEATQIEARVYVTAASAGTELIS